MLKHFFFLEKPGSAEEFSTYYIQTNYYAVVHLNDK